MRPCSKLMVALLALPLSFACNPEIEHRAATQITVRVYVADTVSAQIAQLHVRSYRERFGYDRPRGERWFAAREFEDVVDIVLAQTAATMDEGGLLVVVDAVDGKGRVLAQTRATFEFLLAEQRLLELWLYPCGGLGELCSDPDCRGMSCLTCVHEQCVVTPSFDPTQLAAFNPESPALRKEPPWRAGTLDAGEPDGCDGERCQSEDADTPYVDSLNDDAGSDGALPPIREAGTDAASTPSDAGFDAGHAGMDGGLEAGIDAGDAGMDAGKDAGDASLDAAEAGLPDVVMPDVTPNLPDTGLEPVGRCAQGSAWTSALYAGAIPANAPRLAGHTTSDRGSLPQYICRVTTPDGTLTPAKVSQDPANASLFDFGCFAAYNNGRAWVEYANYDPNYRFDVLTPPSGCQLDWVSVAAGAALPARALPIGGSASAPLYSCRITINRSSDGVVRMGTHMGRVSATPGEPCRVQYYGGVEQVSAFEVLVQMRP